MHSSTVLSLQNITRIYPGPVPVHALSDINLNLAPKEFAALIGPSGSGKTTLLNLCGGLDRPSSGQVRIGERIISELPQGELCLFRRSHVGFVFQAYNLFSELTIVENVEYTSIIRGDNKKEARDRAKKALIRVGLEQKLSNFPRELSGGQQQRVAVARAIASHPQIIFADEPTANLDTATAMDLISLFEDLNRELGVTFLFSTHDPRLISRVKRVIKLEDGKISSSL